MKQLVAGGGVALIGVTLVPLPVSYTHLDVYKRQMQSCCMISPATLMPKVDVRIS